MIGQVSGFFNVTLLAGLVSVALLTVPPPQLVQASLPPNGFPEERFMPPPAEPHSAVPAPQPVPVVPRPLVRRFGPVPPLGPVTNTNVWYLARLIYGEARSNKEPYEGKCAAAWVAVYRTQDGTYPGGTVLKDVITAKLKTKNGKVVKMFDGYWVEPVDDEYWRQAQRIARDVLAGHCEPTGQMRMARYFQTPDAPGGTWQRENTYIVGRLGGHEFRAPK